MLPLLIRNPVGGTQPGSTDSLAELIDLFPTLTELCGLPQPEGSGGIQSGAGTAER
jgi:iduronate 2-sulfatase